MATGGYKSVSFSWQGGRTDTPVERTKFVLNGICDAIIGANVGWQYDTLMPTSADFIQMPSYSNTDYPVLLKVLKLEYNSHVYRLGFGYVYSHAAFQYENKSLKPSDCSNTHGSDYYGTSKNGKFDGGLFFGMVKDGSFITDSTYGAVWDGNGIFTNWTPFSGYSLGYNSCAYQNTGTNLYSYYFVLKNSQLIISFRVSEWTSHTRLKTFITGDIFTTTGHSTDTNTLGTICLFSSNAPEIQDPNESYLQNSDQGETTFPNYSNTFAFQSVIITASGSTYAGYYVAAEGSSTTVVYQPWIRFDSVVVSNYVSSTVASPGGRWTPCWMSLNAADHDTYGVVPGDGFKGYVDTDLLRGVNPNYGYGQQLDGGNFVYLGGGFAIGWDPSNTVPLF